jgi:hypothetical protein
MIERPSASVSPIARQSAIQRPALHAIQVRRLGIVESLPDLRAQRAELRVIKGAEPAGECGVLLALCAWPTARGAAKGGMYPHARLVVWQQ